ncbi:MAG: hypothetical protein ACE5G3_06315 [Gammaproteobacteria bacterium]
MSADIEVPDSHRVAIAHRIAVMKAGRFVWLLIIGLSVYGIWSSQWYLIAVAIISGLLAMAFLSFQAANKVKKLTGLSHAKQAEIWEQYKSIARST